MKKAFLLRIDEEIHDRIKDIAETEDRSVNYMMCKLISKGLDGIALDSNIEKEIEEYATKAKVNKSELIGSIWQAYKKTFIK